MQKCWNGYNFDWIFFKGQKNGIFSHISWKLLIFAVFVILGKIVQNNAISNARNFLTMQNFHFLTYGLWQKRTRFDECPLFGLLLCFTYIQIYVYNKDVGSCCFVLAVGSASDRSSMKCSVIFKKMPKPRNIKIVTFRKHFSHNLKRWFNMFLFWHFNQFYFFAQFLAKESVPKTFF